MVMPNPDPKNRVALIAGPTASGKTGLAIALANYDNGQKYIIINADSAQIYGHLPILSAHPSTDELQKADHKLLGYRDGSTACSAVQWANDAKKEIKRAHAENIIPILVGGTGLYLRTLLEGIAPIPEIDTEIRQEIRKMETQDAYLKLQKNDPIMAQKLHPNDTVRIARALEVMLSTHISMNDWRENKEGGIANEIDLKPLILLPPRQWLYDRCDKRFEQMMNGGAVEEVKALMAHNPPSDSPLWRAIGVKEIRAYLENEISYQEAIVLGQIATRQYAKRQYTWFRNQSPEHWLRAESEINFNNINNFITLFQ